MQKALVDNQWKLEDVITLIKVHYQSDETGKLLELDASKSIADAIGNLTAYFSFFNYSIIQLFVDELNTKAIKKKMKKYKAAFREYSKRRICECPAGTFGSC